MGKRTRMMSKKELKEGFKVRLKEDVLVLVLHAVYVCNNNNQAF
jgi:hypothetical protein